MAYVKIRWGKSASARLEYIAKDRSENDVASTHGCSIETAEEEFAQVCSLHNKEKGPQCLHIMQSWSDKQSALRSVDEFHEMGRKLALEQFPDHQFVIRTHTDKKHIHNHIVVNTVNMESGRKIQNKKALIPNLRAASDMICLRNGLSIIFEKDKKDQAKLPYKVQQMIRFQKPSYLDDLVLKANFARSYATNYNEYSSILGEFKIGVQIQNKNITYFYPGREKGKRGSKLGFYYDKEGLEQSFTQNISYFANHPSDRRLWKTQIERFKGLGFEHARFANDTLSIHKKNPSYNFNSIDRHHDSTRACELIGSILKQSGVRDASASMTLYQKGYAQVSKGMTVRFLNPFDAESATEFNKTPEGQWKRQSVGIPHKPFFQTKPHNKKALFVFSDPLTFISKYGSGIFSDSKPQQGILALFTENKAAVDDYVKKHGIKMIFHIASPNPRKEEIDFFGNLKKVYAKHGIHTEQISHTSDLEYITENRSRGRARGGFSLGL